MQKNYTILLLISLFIFFTPACTTKKLFKQAQKLEMSGMYKEAAEIYYMSLVRKPNKAEFKTALRRAGFMYVEDASQSIAGSFSQGNYQKVVYDFKAVEDFTLRARNTGVDIQIDPNTRRLYENAQGQYLADKYEAGLKLLAEQRFGEAKTVFTEIHSINPEYKDTRIHLNTATLEPFYQNGNSYFSQKNFMGAYHEWAKITAVDPNYKDAAQRMLSALNERYKEGNLLLMNEDFAPAAVALGEVFKVNPNYNDVRKLYTEAQCEPLLRSAIQNISTGRCRQAYLNFLKINEIAGGDYKDTSRLKLHALDCASYPVAVLTRITPGNTADGGEFETELIQEILKKEDPFIKIHSLPSLNQRVYRTLINTTGTIDRGLLRELHDRQGIKAILVVGFLQYDKVQGNLQKKDKKGIYRVSHTNEQGVISFTDRPVDYSEYSNLNRVALNLNYQLISTQTGEILLSQRLSSNEQSDVAYAVFEGGEAKNLYPSLVVNGSLSLDERNYPALQSLLTGDKTIVPVSTLKEKVFGDLSFKISDALVKFNPER